MSRAAAAKGKVFLVGAGPGDPGLLTLRGREVLGQAEVLVYDLLANPELLALAPPTARRINAGKRAGAHVLGQDETNALLVRLGRQGKRVVRLKGGDPFVFGRGGEEALALADAGVPFEVVPGVSSGIAAPAYAGIPVTHRGLASAVVFATGQERSGKPLRPATLKALAKLDATLAFFMATQSVDRVARALVRYGKPASTPAACVMNGTLPEQRVLLTTLGRLAEDMRGGGFGAPGLLLVGPVAALRQRLAWFESRPLFGRRYIVTRAREQASRLSADLRALGAEVWEVPALRIEALPLDKAMRKALSAIDAMDWLVLTSVNGVEHFFARLFEAGLDARALRGCRIAAVGRSTAEALAARGLKADLVPADYDAEHLLKDLTPRLARSGRRRGVLLARAEAGRPVLPEGLRRLRVPCVDLALYRSAPIGARPKDGLAEAIQSGRVDGVTFTSSGTVEQFRGLFSPSRWRALAPKVRGLCLGPITRKAAEEAGISVALEAPQALIASLIEALLGVDGRKAPLP
ncbi:MAG TPA: uroporphyrinogen-III C-methyltransferase [bacterium]|jgi:uroporphyrinogen III methyltransferase/synthase|nr:uroporphyrinogen-III C-methyltransferase [bacterium]